MHIVFFDLVKKMNMIDKNMKELNKFFSSRSRTEFTFNLVDPRKWHFEVLFFRVFSISSTSLDSLFSYYEVPRPSGPAIYDSVFAP